MRFVFQKRERIKMDFGIFVDAVIGILILVIGYLWKSQADDVKRIDILLNRTREDFASRSEVKEQMDRVLEYLHRLEDKLDRLNDK
tara:strand:+ start:5794 stop:6051 length:258 start_codon:yes stop_codon:yes gene_type:complete